MQELQAHGLEGLQVPEQMAQAYEEAATGVHEGPNRAEHFLIHGQADSSTDVPLLCRMPALCHYLQELAKIIILALALISGPLCPPASFHAWPSRPASPR